MAILGNIQYQGRWGSEQSDLVGDVPCYCRVIGLNGHQRSFPAQMLYDPNYSRSKALKCFSGSLEYSATEQT